MPRKANGRNRDPPSIAYLTSVQSFEIPEDEDSDFSRFPLRITGNANNFTHCRERFSMETAYDSHGIRFRYPCGWELSEQQEVEHFSITVSSPQGAFWTVSLFPEQTEPGEIVATVVNTFREEYVEIDDYPSKARLCRRPTVGRDIDFVSLELLNSACVRAFRTSTYTIMVLFQWTNAGREDVETALERITRSLSCPNESGQGTPAQG